MACVDDESPKNDNYFSYGATCESNSVPAAPAAPTVPPVALKLVEVQLMIKGKAAADAGEIA